MSKHEIEENLDKEEPIKKIEIKNLSLIFGEKTAKEKALEMLKENKDIQEIREKTKAAVAVNDVSFDIYEGEMFVIVGLSGSGKSSLIRCINRLNKPTRGQLLIDGKDVCNLSDQELEKLRRNQISMVFQNFGLLGHRNIQKNVEYGLEIKGISPKERREKALDAIKTVGLDGWEKYYPRQLSGGMKQRVGIARALANDPDILLMDEPFSALDPLIRREMQAELLNLEDYMDKTIVFITHDMNEAFKIGDRIALLKDGQLVQLGNPRDFFEKPANEYVESFIEDVDKSRILRVKSVMRKPIVLAHKSDSRSLIIEKLREKNRDFSYVVDEKNFLLGYVNLDDLENSKDKTIDKLIIEKTQKINRNSFLYEVWSKLDESDVDVAVVDLNNKLRGVISYKLAVKAIK